MTVMPHNAVRLPETATLLVLDPMIGPVSRSIASLALGDEVLVIAAGRMCFRRVMATHEAAAPEVAVEIPAGTLGPDRPRSSIPLDSRQMISVPLVQAIPFPAETQSIRLTAPDRTTWIDVTAEGAERIIVENIAVCTGALAENSLLIPRPMSHAPIPAVPPAILKGEGGKPLRAFSSQTELPLVSTAQDDSSLTYRFTLSPRTTTLRLSSPAVQPAGDGRKLGVAVVRLSLDGVDIPLESTMLVRGFHRAETGESGAWRWTDGEALLILPPKPLSQVFAVSINTWHLLLQPTETAPTGAI